MPEEEVRITLRLPASLRDKLLASAEDRSRSMNGEIVERLDWSFDRATDERANLLKLVHDQDTELQELRERLKKPGAEIGRLKQLLADERDVNRKLESIMEAQFDVLNRSTDVLKSASAQSQQQAGIIDSLCTIIFSLDPSPEVLDLTKRISKAAQDYRERFGVQVEIERGREEAAEVQRLISKADALLEKPKK
ncbi:Arc family DNA-binding protein [Sinorhizobium meliloti]|uniref:Arc family DNA-binding protein n=1 Tax=Rhizobium meliloti TaxID=382 RepID=UPI0004896E97|nr:Arc family DNA-binding protein [Sinorhizobium meliloti]MDE4619609.1 Arc family DNA-binding protein [Sinorhizobium meliloti]